MFDDALKQFQGMQLIAPNPEGAFAHGGLQVQDVGKAMQAAAGEMPGGAQTNNIYGWGSRGSGPKDLGRILATSGPPGIGGGGQSSAGGPAPAAGANPASAPQGAFSSPSSGPASWLANFMK